MKTALERMLSPEAPLFLSDAGLETVLVFEHGLDLLHFSSVTLMADEKGRTTLRDYYTRYANIARRAGCGFIFESPTWRASIDWAEPLGMCWQELARLNREAVALMNELRDDMDHPLFPVLVSGCIGPRSDGYAPEFLTSVEEAREYHAHQAENLVASGVDMISATTMTHPEEAAGIALAAADLGVASVVSFTTETDGRLPTGQTLQEGIERVDELTAASPAYYMVNCAHPDHFRAALDEKAAWTRRIGGIRANASRASHAELDASEALDPGNPEELGQLYAEIRQSFPAIRLLGGCCGTSHQHIEAICEACA
jgi:homocysteine S-methyltransferase